MAINKTYTSNTLYNDSTGVIAFAEQLKQELINWANYHHVTEELGPDNRPDTQNALNNLFLSVYERFLTFLNDADATEEAINTWKEIENFLADYTDEKTLAEIVAELNANIESRLTVPLESTTGSSTTSTMTQKAITDSINSSTTFTTSESVDNIGIDDEPTAGSDNLVKSGGVVTSLLEGGAEINNIVSSYPSGSNYSWKTVFPNILKQGVEYKIKIIANSPSTLTLALCTSEVTGVQSITTFKTNKEVTFTPTQDNTFIRVRCGASIAEATGDLKFYLIDTSIINAVFSSGQYVKNVQLLNNLDVSDNLPKSKAVKKDIMSYNYLNTVLTGEKTGSYLYIPAVLKKGYTYQLTKTSGPAMSLNVSDTGETGGEHYIQNVYLSATNPATATFTAVDDAWGFVMYTASTISFEITISVLIGNSMLQDLSVTNSKLAQNAVGSSDKILDGVIIESKLENCLKNKANYSLTRESAGYIIVNDYKLVAGREYLITFATNPTISSISSIDSNGNVLETLTGYIGGTLKAVMSPTVDAVGFRWYTSGKTYNFSITHIVLESELEDYSIGQTKLKDDVYSAIGTRVPDRSIPESKLKSYEPDYVLGERERVYRKLVALSNSNNIIIAFNTDQHIELTESRVALLDNPMYALRGLKSIVEIGKKLPLDLIVLGGDVAGYDGGVSSTIDGIISEINLLEAPFSDLNTSFISIPGNHDAYQNNANVTANAMYNTYYKRNKVFNRSIQHNGFDNCDCYFDDQDKKIRYIFVDTYTRNVREESYSVFLSDALSTMGSGYKAVIFSHNPLTNEFHNVLFKYLGDSDENPEDAFEGPSDQHTLLDQYADNIIACICGHAHTDAWGFSSSGILYIETTSAVHTRRRFDIIPYAASYGNANETSLDFFVINTEEQQIEAVRYGRGTDRLWKYKGSGARLIGYKNCVNGTTSIASATLVFTNAEDSSDVVTVRSDSNKFFETYLTLKATYNITCEGYTLDVNSVYVDETKNLNITLTANI